MAEAPVPETPAQGEDGFLDAVQQRLKGKGGFPPKKEAFQPMRPPQHAQTMMSELTLFCDLQSIDLHDHWRTKLQLAQHACFCCLLTKGVPNALLVIRRQPYHTTRKRIYHKTTTSNPVFLGEEERGGEKISFSPISSFYYPPPSSSLL